MKLQKWDMPVVEAGETYPVHAYSQGFYSGDGNKNNTYSWVYGDKQVCFSRLIGSRGRYDEVKDCQTWKHGPMLSKTFVPVNGSLSYCLNWLAGLIDADGTVTRDQNGNGVQITSVNKEFLLSVRTMLSRLGVRAKVVDGRPERVVSITNQQGTCGEYNCQATFRLLIGNEDTYRLVQLGLSTLRAEIHGRPPQRDARQYVRVKEVVWTGVEEETFCVTEDTLNQMTVNGIVTGNCAEIGLRPYQFCNLCEVNVSDVVDQDDLNARCKAAAFIGTLQAGYTDFHYLRDIWQETTEKDALIGVGHTGIASNKCANLNLTQAAEIVNLENDRVAALIGINPAARTTTVKPSGTASMVLGCSSGVHAWHNPRYIRRMRVGKNESIYGYLAENHPELLEDEYFRPEQQAVISVPQNAPDGAIYRTEYVFDLLERVKRWNTEWVAPGHRDGQNSHNVSATISIKDDEWEAVGQWMWENREHYTGLSVLPYDGGTYKQAPFEDCSEELFLEMSSHLHAIDLTRIRESGDNTNLSGEVACSGGKCELV
jgi:hypothetical protein